VPPSSPRTRLRHGPPRPTASTVYPTATQKALVGISPTFGNAGLASSPKSSHVCVTIRETGFRSATCACGDRAGGEHALCPFDGKAVVTGRALGSDDVGTTRGVGELLLVTFAEVPLVLQAARRSFGPIGDDCAATPNQVAESSF
jgi:hypothetical protein